MKIESINFVEASAVPRPTRNTKTNANLLQVLSRVKELQLGKALVIAGSDFKSFDRWTLQRGLQKRGEHVRVSAGIHPQTSKPALFIVRMNEAEWKEYIEEQKVRSAAHQGVHTGKRGGKK